MFSWAVTAAMGLYESLLVSRSQPVSKKEANLWKQSRVLHQCCIMQLHSDPEKQQTLLWQQQIAVLNSNSMCLNASMSMLAML